jgi:hypothetical protein
MAAPAKAAAKAAEPAKAAARVRAAVPANLAVPAKQQQGALICLYTSSKGNKTLYICSIWM